MTPASPITLHQYHPPDQVALWGQPVWAPLPDVLRRVKEPCLSTDNQLLPSQRNVIITNNYISVKFDIQT